MKRLLVVALAVGAVVAPSPAGAASSPRTWGAQLHDGSGTLAGTVQVTANPVTALVCADAALVAAGGIAIRTSHGLLPISTGPTGCLTDVDAATAVLAGSAQVVEQTDAAPDGVASGVLAPVADRTVPFAVGTSTFTTKDSSRNTMRRRGNHLVTIKGRTLLTHVFYPATGVAGPADHPGAAPAAGPYPVVVFAHGYDVTPAFYERTLHAFAQAGYVVLAPELPGATSSGRCCATEADIAQQPRDLRKVLDAATVLARSPGSVLGGLLDLQHVAAVGHSDGGTTVAGLVEDPAQRDSRIDAAIVLSGGRLDDAATTGTTVPTLLMAGQHDEYNDQGVFRRVFAQLTGPRLWVQAVNGSHAGPFTQGTPQAAVLRQIEVAFLDHELRGLPTQDLIRSLASQPGVTRSKGGGIS